MKTRRAFAKAAGASVSRIFAILGQSNAEGHAELTTATAPALATYAPPYPDVRLRQQVANTNTLPIPFVSFAAGPVAPRAQYLGGDTTSGNFGVELTMARVLAASGGAPCDIVKFAVGSSDLAGQWHPDQVSSSYQYGANLYTQCVAFLLEQERALRGVLSGLVWIQGEADAAVLGSANAYQANLGILLARLRVLWPGLPVVVSQLSVNNGGAYKATVRTAQQNVVAADTNAALVNADDLTVVGGQHYDANGLITLGTRLGNAMLGLQPPATKADAVPFSIDATSGKPTPRGPWEWGNLIAAAGLTGKLTAGPKFHFDATDPTAAQGGDGNAHDSVGGMWLPSAGGTTLQSAIAGWSKKGATFSNVANGGFRVGTNNGYNTATQSVFGVARVVCPVPDAAERAIMLLTDGGTIAVSQTINGKLKCYGAQVTAPSVNSHATGAALLIGLRYNRTAGTLTLLTSLEKLALTYQAATIDSAKGICDWSSIGMNPNLSLLDWFVFVDSDAEMTDAQVKLLYQGLGETIPWT